MRLTLEQTKKIDIPGDPDGGYVNIRLLTLHQLGAIEAKCNNTGLNESSDMMVTIEPFKRENMVARACLTGWGHMFDAKGKEMKFTQKNLRNAEAFVITVDDAKIRFLEWVDQAHAAFYDENEETLKEVSEN